MESLPEQIETRESAMQERNHSQQPSEDRVRLWRGVAGVLAVVSLLILPLRAGKAQGPNSNLETRVTALENQVAALKTALNNEIAARQAGDTSLQNQINPLAAKLASVTVSGNDLFITGNLHVVNGMGRTDSANGLGNLIVGYNELDTSYGPQTRTGSHNVVLGTFNSYTSYGGLVIGAANKIWGPFCVVSGGTNNTANGSWASVSAGQRNTASGLFASVSGGNGNTAGGDYSSVSGGNGNVASGTNSSVSGGILNRASGDYSSILGGNAITVSTNAAHYP